MTTPARAAAHAVLVRSERSSRPLDLSWGATPEFDGLEARDRVLAYELVTGTLRRRGSLDAVLAAVAEVDTRRVAPGALVCLRLGAFQILFLDRVPVHAAVSESVSLAGSEGRRSSGFVNAVLRRVGESGRAAFEDLSAGDEADALAVRYSVPRWLVEGWREELGEEAATGVLAASCEPPERCLRVNRLRATRERAARALAKDGVATRAVEGLPDALVVEEGRPLETTTAFREGQVTAQSRGSQLVGHVVAEGAAAAGRTPAVLDLCAAPGGKTAHLAALMPGADIVAGDSDPRRVSAMRANLARLGVRAAYDAVLVDAPCSGLGVLSSRPDLRWRRGSMVFLRRNEDQHALLAAGAASVAPGGALTYAVCTLTRIETVAVIDDLSDDGWSVEDLAGGRPSLRDPWHGRCLVTLPGRDGSSGFFIARLRRRA